MKTPQLAAFVLMSAASGAVVTSVAVLGLQAAADQNPSTDNVPKLIPYTGTLEQDGRRVDAAGADALWMRFDIHDGSAAGSPVVYSQRQPVDVVNGRFETVIGPVATDNTALEDVIKGADDLWIDTTLLNDPDDDTDDITLSHPQRLSLTPYVLWATNAVDFEVGQDMRVDGAVDVLTDPASTLSSPTLDNASSVNPGSLRIAFGGSVTIGGEHSSVGAANGQTTIGGSARMSGPLTVTGDAQIDQDATGAQGMSGVSQANLTTVEGLTSLCPGGPRIDAHGSVSFLGQVALRANTADAVGLDFKDNPIPNDTGDDAWIRYYTDVDNVASNDSALQLAVANDQTDDVQFLLGPTGAVVMNIQGGSGTERRTRINGNVTLAGPLRGGSLGNNSNPTSVEVPGEGVQNSNTPGTWRGGAECGANEYVCGFQVRQSPDNAGDLQGTTDVIIRCCDF